MIPDGSAYEPGDEIQWGVSPDPQPVRRTSFGRLAWIILSILIILSLVLPWILPYLAPQPRPVRDGLQAILIEMLHV